MKYFPLIIIIIVASSVAAIMGFILYDAYSDPPRHTVSVNYVDPRNFFIIPDRETGFRHRPRFKKIIELVNINHLGKQNRLSYPVFHNLLGARVAKSDETVLDQVDIVAVGGSQTWGAGVLEEQTFPSILAALMGKTHLNFGINSAGGVISYFEMKRHLFLKPEWVVYGFWEDHINRNLHKCNALLSNLLCIQKPSVARITSDKMGFEFPDNPEKGFNLALQYYLTMSENRRGLSWNDVVWTFRRLERQINKKLHPEVHETTITDEKLDAAIFTLFKMSQAVRNTGTRLIVVYIPDYFRKTIRAASPIFFDAAKRDNYIFIDLGKAFAQILKNGGKVGGDIDAHLSANAHRVIAKEIFEELRRRELVKN